MIKSRKRSYCKGQIQYGHVNHEIGYLRILSLDDYSDTTNSFQAMNAALNEILSDPVLQSLVLDLRVNLGGDDRLGLAFASRFTQIRYPAYVLKVRANKEWIASETISVEATAPPRFTRQIVELIGPLTMSAGETFTQALMGRSPHVLRVGEATQGLSGSVLQRHLPNGWQFGLPNTILFTFNGVDFDGIGIPPDTPAPVFKDEDIANKEDPSMAVAVKALRP